MRQSGILMHISSLPSEGGIGTLGREAYHFADFLKTAGMRIWQVLPVGPVGYGESPYQSTSIFAGNPMLIDFPRMREEGLLDFKDDELYVPEQHQTVEFDAVRANKETLLRKAFSQSAAAHKKELDNFVRENSWVEDYALFTAVKRHFDNAMWTKWPDKAIRLRQPRALRSYRKKLDEDVRYHIFVQWVFFKQWYALKSYVNGLGIKLFGDMPIYVAEDSADTWTHPEVFQLDKDRVPVRVAGVPPDCFSEDGQLWGNPLYDWDYLKKTDFAWWVERMRANSYLYDILRVDHFIGFGNYYSIPYGAPNAKNGEWILAPGSELFHTLKRELPGLNVIAEDLGNVTPRVRALIDETGYPGMKVFTFAFGGGEGNPHDPACYGRNFICYTGTHDNDTALGWYCTADEKARKEARELLHFTTEAEAPYALICGTFRTICDTAIVPMQDVLALPHECRMNLPGTTGGNWGWRMLPGAATPVLAEKLHQLNEATGRL